MRAEGVLFCVLGKSVILAMFAPYCASVEVLQRGVFTFRHGYLYEGPFQRDLTCHSVPNAFR